MSSYPEHEKLAKVRDASQEIGEFLEFGLPRIGGGLTLYERVTRECECSWCQAKTSSGRHSPKASRWHTEEELATAGWDPDTGAMERPVQVEEWQPTMRTIPAMLAAYFDIDPEKIDAEKAQMLKALRAAS